MNRCASVRQIVQGFRFVVFAILMLLQFSLRPARAGFPVDRKVPIFAASADGDVQQLNALLDKHPELLEYKGPFGITPLIVAAGQGQLKAVELLLDRGADIRASTIVDGTALHAAVAGGQTDVVRVLLKRGAVPGAKGMPRSETPLYVCAAQGDLNIARMLIEAGAPVNVRTEQSRETPLMAAAATGHADIVRLLLEKGASADERDYNGDTALSMAARAGHNDVVAALVGKGADTGNALGEPPLSPEELKDPVKVADRAAAVANATKDIIPAAADGDLKRVKAYVALLPDLVNASGRDSRAVLEAAVLGKNLDIVTFLLDKGADTRRIDSPMRGGVMNSAVRSGSREMVELLLSRHVGVNGSDQRFGPDRTPLCTAAETGNKAMAELLLSHGADVDRTSWPDLTPLHLAAAKGDVEMATLLLDSKANIDSHGDRGGTPLYSAAVAGQVAMVEFLLNHGADAKTHFGGQSVLTAAAFAGRTDVVKYLTAHGFEADVFALVATDDLPELKKRLKQDATLVNARDGFGRTPLHLAVVQPDEKIAAALIEAGADVNARDRSGGTSLQGAAATPRRDGNAATVIRLLLEKGADINARDGIGRTALDGPIMDPAIRPLLLKHGARLSSELGPMNPRDRFPGGIPGKPVRVGDLDIFPGGELIQSEEHVSVTSRNEDGKLRRIIEIDEGDLKVVASSLGSEPAEYSVTNASNPHPTVHKYPTKAALIQSDTKAAKLLEKYVPKIERGELQGSRMLRGPIRSGASSE